MYHINVYNYYVSIKIIKVKNVQMERPLQIQLATL